MTFQKMRATDEIRVLRFAPRMEMPSVSPTESHADAFDRDPRRKSTKPEHSRLATLTRPRPKEPAILSISGDIAQILWPPPHSHRSGMPWIIPFNLIH